MEHMRVRIGETGNRQAPQNRPLPRGTDFHRGDRAIRHIQTYPLEHPVVEPRVLTPVGRHVANRSNTAANAAAPCSTSSASANSSGAWLMPAGLRTYNMPAGTRDARIAASCPAPVASAG